MMHVHSTISHVEVVSDECNREGVTVALWLENGHRLAIPFTQSGYQSIREALVIGAEFCVQGLLTPVMPKSRA